MTFYTPRNISPADQILFDSDGNAVGIQPAASSSPPVLGFNPTKHAAIDSLVSDAGIGPLKITAPDGYDVGDVLTATPQPGWTVGGYQWTRDGADISGATSSTYTLTLADVQMPHLPAKVIGCEAVSPLYTYLTTLPVSATFPAGYLSLDNSALSNDGAVLSLV